MCRHFDLFFLGVKILLTSSVGGVWILNGMALMEQYTQSYFNIGFRLNANKRLYLHSTQKNSLCHTERENLKMKRLKVSKWHGKEKRRQQIPSELNPQNSEKFQYSMKGRTSRRRRKETLDSCKVIHGDCEGNIWKLRLGIL